MFNCLQHIKLRKFYVFIINFELTYIYFNNKNIMNFNEYRCYFYGY